MIYIGTSGFSYAEWKGSFYPRDLSSDGYLSFYARHFPTTEINNTFYRTPSPKVTAAWAEQVPEEFRFTLKLTQKITHKKRIRDVDEEMTWFFRGAEPLGEKLGCVLVQLPPWFRKDLELLEAFLGDYGDRAPLALEFRHASWFEEDTYGVLERSGAALVASETDDQQAPRRLTAPFFYLRLRKSAYAEEELGEWAAWLNDAPGDGFVYFKHDREAPALADRLRDLLQA